MLVDDLDISPDKIDHTARQVLDRAVDESRRRKHGLLTSEHVFIAFAHTQWDRYVEMMRDAGLNPQAVLHEVQQYVRTIPPSTEATLCASPTTKLLFKLALHQAGRAGRSSVAANDLLFALFAEKESVLALIFRRHKVEPELLASRLTVRVRDREEQHEWLKKRFELPPVLRHFGTNLNLLVHQVFSASGLRAQPRDPAGRRSPEPSRASQLRHAGRRARRRQDRNRRGPRARIESNPNRAGAAPRLPDHQPPNERIVAGTSCAGCSRTASRT